MRIGAGAGARRTYHSCCVRARSSLALQLGLSTGVQVSCFRSSIPRLYTLHRGRSAVQAPVGGRKATRCLCFGRPQSQSGRRRHSLESGRKCMPTAQASFRQIAVRRGTVHAGLVLRLRHLICAVMARLPMANLQSRMPLKRAKFVVHPLAPSKVQQQQISSALSRWQVPRRRRLS